MDANQISLTVTTIATALANELSDDDLCLVALIFNQLGETLETIAEYREVLNAKREGLDLSDVGQELNSIKDD